MSAEGDVENIDWIGLVAERKIQDALEEGLFDNLPGAGKPINLQINPFEPPGMGAVNRLLAQNRVLPPWLLLEREIEAARGLALGTLARWERAAPGLRDDPAYPALRRTAREAYEQHMTHCNHLILKYLHTCPFVLRAPVTMMIRTRLREFEERYGDDLS